MTRRKTERFSQPMASTGSLTAVALLILLAAPLQAFANANSCEDYLSRHQKIDIVPFSLEFNNITNGGDVEPEYQVVMLAVRNVGSRIIRGTTENGEKRRLRVSINGVERSTDLQGIAPNTALGFRLIMPKNTVRHCQRVLVRIDLDHTAGQWGCQVWNNDSKTIQAIRRDPGFSRECREKPTPGRMQIPARD